MQDWRYEMLVVYGHIKDREDFILHNKPIINGDYSIGIDFEIVVDAVSLDTKAMPIEESNALILDQINKKYHTDFRINSSFINPLHIKELISSDEKIINKVNDDIFAYQYSEARALIDKKYYLGAACVFGVALERVCILIAQHNNLKIKEDKTELGFFAYKLFNAKIISDAFKKRLLGTAKFRNLSAHSNGQAVKSDALTLDAVINDLVDEYL